MNVFRSGQILVPNEEYMEKWAVIACDQFTSQPEYWQRVRNRCQGARSCVNVILPEAELNADMDIASSKIWRNMDAYLQDDFFRVYDNAYIYVERTLQNGSIRKGIVGVVDLEAYDFHVGSDAAIRSTEETVLDRIPPRKKIREGASLEVSHVLMLCDDDKCELIEPLAMQKHLMEKVYEFDLMEDGGHIVGYLVKGSVAQEFESRFHNYVESATGRYADLGNTNVVLAVGDGNHSVAAAKSCYEQLKAEVGVEAAMQSIARYALVELVNIHDDVIVFEPILRIVKETDVDGLLHFLREHESEEGFEISCVRNGVCEKLVLRPDGHQIAIAALQELLDEWLIHNEGKVDYIHGEEDLKTLTFEENSLGFLLPALEKHQLFRGVICAGSLPRKTFSMGHAREKRYYLEGRRIK